MGVIYKLKPKIKEFILKINQEKPQFGCRKISTLLEKKLKIKISKSTVNSVIKAAGLRMPVGRRRKAKRDKIEAEGLGAIFLKAADCLFGAGFLINEAIKERRQIPDQSLAKVESLLYSSLFFDIKTKTNLTLDSGLWAMINERFNYIEILSYLNYLEQLRSSYIDIFRIISTALKEVHCLKVLLSDGSSYFLDGQIHTVWSTSYIPHDFAATHYNIKGYIDKYFIQNNPIVIFMAPGYDMPTKEFFDFMYSIDSADPQITKITLYGNKFEEIENIRIDEVKKRNLIFGLWPWQFAGYRKVKLLGDFTPYYSEMLKKQLYLSKTEIELMQPTKNKGVTLKGYALKLNLNEKISLVILSNYDLEQIKPEVLLESYFSRWPNLQEGFQDFSRKVELFTYTATSRRFFSTENLKLDPKDAQTTLALLQYYLQALDLYVRWHFLPSGYEEKSFEIARNRFYNLKGQIKRQKGLALVTFKTPSGYPYLKDLEYACRRINEREIILPEGQRLRCQVS